MCRAPRTAATTSWLVTPCGLSMTSRPELSGFVVIVPILDLDIVIIVEVVIIGLVVLVRIGVAGVLRVGAGLGEFFVALVCEREDVLDLMASPGTSSKMNSSCGVSRSPALVPTRERRRPLAWFRACCARRRSPCSCPSWPSWVQ